MWYSFSLLIIDTIGRLDAMNLIVDDIIVHENEMLNALRESGGSGGGQVDEGKQRRLLHQT